MNKIATTLTALLLAICAQAAAPKAWVDVTDKYIRNPRFDGNDYWSYWEGTQFGAAGPHENAEHYQRNYDTYQNLSGLTPGKYRLSLSAFYRMGEAGDDYRIYSSGNYSENQHAKLYASSSKGTYQVSIAPSSSAALSESLGGNASEVGNWRNRLYIPNNMQAAYFWFEAGYYKNTVQCEVGEDGNLRIGVRKDVTVNGDWTCLDNWKLEVYTEINPVTSITFDRAQIEMVIGQILTVEPIIAPADATIQTVTWKTNNDKVLSVDKETGEIVALAKGSATVSAVATDGSLEYGNFKVDVLDNDPSSENIIINEIMAQNIDVYLDPNQNYGSWVELYNPTDRSVNLEGLYVTDDRNNLKKHKLALQYYLKAVEIQEKALGVNHPDIAIAYNNIGTTLEEQGDYTKALEYHLKALNIQEQTLGFEHPSTALSYNNIGSIHYHLKNYQEALVYYLKALEIWQKSLGEDHPNVQTVKKNIDAARQMMKKS